MLVEKCLTSILCVCEGLIFFWFEENKMCVKPLIKFKISDKFF